MPLTLYARYTPSDAVAAFNDVQPQWLYDGRYAILPRAILCFFTIESTPDGTCVSSPTRLNWRPDVAKSRKDFKRLPEVVRKIYDRNGDRDSNPRDYHLLLRAHDGEPFLYVGTAHLASYGSGETRRGFESEFSLDDKLPRDLWLSLGGYPGWLVEVDHQSRRVSAGDVAEFERQVRSLAEHEFAHLEMTRYEEDSLCLHTNASRGWLMYLKAPDDSGLYTCDREYDGPPGSIETFRCGCGIDLEFEADQTLPREVAERVIVEFFRTGGLPTTIPWKPM